MTAQESLARYVYREAIWYGWRCPCGQQHRNGHGVCSRCGASPYLLMGGEESTVNQALREAKP